ncbi:MAG: hypothetical protein H7138_15260 [Myxococcales bacterium]|nr:hypothetical protein [Myxococcales bacterium]
MAHADAFPASALPQLAEDVAEWLDASGLPTDDMTIAAVPLLIWDIGTGNSILEATTSSGEWHHQIVRASQPIAFARSRARVENDQVELLEIAESPLTAAIDDVIRSLRASPRETRTLRLLRIQRNHTTCMWLHDPAGGDEVISLQSPVWERGLRIDEATFLRMVRVLPGPGLIEARDKQRRESPDPWHARRWANSSIRPVRQLASAF